MQAVAHLARVHAAALTQPAPDALAPVENEALKMVRRTRPLEEDKVAGRQEVSKEGVGLVDGAEDEHFARPLLGEPAGIRSGAGEAPAIRRHISARIGAAIP